MENSSQDPNKAVFLQRAWRLIGGGPGCFTAILFIATMVVTSTPKSANDYAYSWRGGAMTILHEYGYYAIGVALMVVAAWVNAKARAIEHLRLVLNERTVTVTNREVAAKEESNCLDSREAAVKQGEQKVKDLEEAAIIRDRENAAAWRHLTDERFELHQIAHELATKLGGKLTLNKDKANPRIWLYDDTGTP